MNKSLWTNLIAGGVFVAAYVSPDFAFRSTLLNAGLFALSGGVTNWLAIHMLFERVPGLYGSGIIPQNFEKLKEAIRELIMDNFFTEEDYHNYVHNTWQRSAEEIADKIHYSEIFDDLVALLINTPIGTMLNKFRGKEILEKLREPFIEKFRIGVTRVLKGPYFAKLLEDESTFENLRSQVEVLIDRKLDEFTPQMVKKLIQHMIQEHLGWLVVWGGVFGGIIGILSSLFFV